MTELRAALALAGGLLLAGGCAAGLPAAAAPAALEARPGPPGTETLTLSWPVPDVFQAILDGLDGDRPLDPASINAYLAARQRRPDPSAGRPPEVRRIDYPCAANDFHLPRIFVDQICPSSGSLNMYVYGKVSGAPGFRIDAFLASAARRQIEIVYPWSYPDFAEPRSTGHLPWPTVERLVMSRDRSSLVVIVSLGGDDGDVMSIVVLTAR
jgi:hypothetical protein